MPIFSFEIKDGRGRRVGYKTVRASSAGFIRGHRNRFVGGDRRIGKIFERRERTMRGAMRNNARAEGYRVVNGVRTYGAKKRARTGPDFGIGRMDGGDVFGMVGPPRGRRKGRRLNLMEL